MHRHARNPQNQTKQSNSPSFTTDGPRDADRARPGPQRARASTDAVYGGQPGHNFGRVSVFDSMPMSAGRDSASLQALLNAARSGTAGPGEPLPHLNRIQAAFGEYDLGPVSAHTSTSATKACQLIGASGYTLGHRVALSDTSLFNVSHEAAHIVHQRQGALSEAGIGKRGDVYEQHADAVARAVTSGRSAVPLLDAFTAHRPQSASGADVLQLNDKLAPLPREVLYERWLFRFDSVYKRYGAGLKSSDPKKRRETLQALLYRTYAEIWNKATHSQILEKMKDLNFSAPPWAIAMANPPQTAPPEKTAKPKASAQRNPDSPQLPFLLPMDPDATIKLFNQFVLSSSAIDSMVTELFKSHLNLNPAAFEKERATVETILLVQLQFMKLSRGNLAAYADVLNNNPLRDPYKAYRAMQFVLQIDQTHVPQIKEQLARVRGIRGQGMERYHLIPEGPTPTAEPQLPDTPKRRAFRFRIEDMMRNRKERGLSELPSELEIFQGQVAQTQASVAGAVVLPLIDIIRWLLGAESMTTQQRSLTLGAFGPFDAGLLYFGSAAGQTQHLPRYRAPMSLHGTPNARVVPTRQSSGQTLKPSAQTKASPTRTPTKTRAPASVTFSAPSRKQKEPQLPRALKPRPPSQKSRTQPKERSRLGKAKEKLINKLRPAAFAGSLSMQGTERALGPAAQIPSTSTVKHSPTRFSPLTPRQGPRGGQSRTTKPAMPSAASPQTRLTLLESGRTTPPPTSLNVPSVKHRLNMNFADSAGVTVVGRRPLSVEQMRWLSHAHKVEFALVYVAPRKSPRNPRGRGVWVLIRGDKYEVMVPVLPNIRLIFHTHLAFLDNTKPSRADQEHFQALRRSQRNSARLTQRGSIMIPVERGAAPVRYAELTPDGTRTPGSPTVSASVKPDPSADIANIEEESIIRKRLVMGKLEELDVALKRRRVEFAREKKSRFGSDGNKEFSDARELANRLDKVLLVRQTNVHPTEVAKIHIVNVLKNLISFDILGADGRNIGGGTRAVRCPEGSNLVIGGGLIKVRPGHGGQGIAKDFFRVLSELVPNGTKMRFAVGNTQSKERLALLRNIAQERDPGLKDKSLDSKVFQYAMNLEGILGVLLINMVRKSGWLPLGFDNIDGEGNVVNCIINLVNIGRDK